MNTTQLTYTHLVYSSSLLRFLQMEGLPIEKIETTHQTYIRINVDMQRDEVFRLGIAYSEWRIANPQLA